MPSQCAPLLPIKLHTVKANVSQPPSSLSTTSHNRTVPRRAADREHAKRSRRRPPARRERPRAPHSIHRGARPAAADAQPRDRRTPCSQPLRTAGPRVCGTRAGARGARGRREGRRAAADGAVEGASAARPRFVCRGWTDGGAGYGYVRPV